MTMVCMLLAGMALGIWHCREVEAARRGGKPGRTRTGAADLSPLSA